MSVLSFLVNLVSLYLFHGIGGHSNEEHNHEEHKHSNCNSHKHNHVHEEHKHSNCNSHKHNHVHVHEEHNHNNCNSHKHNHVHEENNHKNCNSHNHHHKKHSNSKLTSNDTNLTEKNKLINNSFSGKKIISFLIYKIEISF